MNTITINLSLPKTLLEQADSFARQESRTRSELFREALRAYLSEMTDWEKIYAYGRKTARKFGIKSEEDVYRIIDNFRKEERAKKKNCFGK